MSVAQAFDGVAVEDGDDRAAEVSEREIGRKKESVASSDALTSRRLFRQRFAAPQDARAKERQDVCSLRTSFLVGKEAFRDG